MLRDNLASRFKIQNASTNVTYGPKKDKNLTNLFKFINTINNFENFVKQLHMTSLLSIWDWNLCIINFW